MSLHYDIDGPVARFTIDNGRLNIMSGDMYEELFVALSKFIADDSLKVGIISGSDSGNFCAGDDIKSVPRPIHSVPHWLTVVTTMRRNKPIIAAADGWSLGGGFHLLLSIVGHTCCNSGSPLRISRDQLRNGRCGWRKSSRTVIAPHNRNADANDR